jgi:RNA polymerase sigma-70 factor (ECF subfamily)
MNSLFLVLCPVFPHFLEIYCSVFGNSTFMIMLTAEVIKTSIMRDVDLENCMTEQDILIQEAKREGAAFARLYRMHYERVFRYCSRRLFNRHAAEDVTSTVFFKVMQSISSFEGNSSDFCKWLYRIATNAVNDHLRTSKRRVEAIRNATQEHDRGHSASARSDGDLQKINLELKQAVLGMKPKYQTVVTLRFFEKMKLIEIAEIMSQNQATTRSQLSRALSHLRKTLEASADWNREV